MQLLASRKQLVSVEEKMENKNCNAGTGAQILALEVSIHVSIKDNIQACDGDEPTGPAIITCLAMYPSATN